MQDHISYFAFSGTPKNKTLELFGRQGRRRESWSRSTSIRCAKVSAKVLRWTCCRTTPPFSGTFELVKSVPEDKEYEKARTLRALTNYVDLQPHSIETKTRIILEQFTARKQQRRSKGKGRAMLGHAVSVTLCQIQNRIR